METKETPPFNLVILLSGNGSTMQAIIDAIHAGTLNANISTVVCDREDAYGLIRAQNAQLQTTLLIPEKNEERDNYNKRLLNTLVSFDPDLIVLAGFMRIIGPDIVKTFAGKILNIHPALLPKFPGLNTHAKAIASGETEHGTSIHFVTDELDGGPLIAQASCPIFPTDTVESLEARVKRLEHQLYPAVLQWFCEKRVQCLAQGVMLDEVLLTKTGIMTDYSF